jgi:hypothetical protein
MCPKNMAEPRGSLMLRPLLLVLVVTTIGCTTSLPPGSSPPAVTQAGQVSQPAVQQGPIQQKECTTGFSDPCSMCMLKCTPGGNVCNINIAAPPAAMVACIHANCTEACPDDR